MISDTPVIEFVLFKQPDESYTAWVSGLNGRVDWELFEEFKFSMTEEPYIFHPEIKPILAKYDHERDGAITIIAELSKVDHEEQYGTGEGEINRLPAFYDITNCKVTKFEPLTLR